MADGVELDYAPKQRRRRKIGPVHVIGMIAFGAAPVLTLIFTSLDSGAPAGAEGRLWSIPLLIWPAAGWVWAEWLLLYARRRRFNQWLGARLGAVAGALAFFASVVFIGAPVAMADGRRYSAALLLGFLILSGIAGAVGAFLGFCIGGIARGLMSERLLGRETRK